MQNTVFTKTLSAWYALNKRNLPWREHKDPYKVWLSEIILQQTRVEQGTSYYLKFIENFPTVKHLANAKEDTVLKLWQGLGYYSRARNLHAAAKEIVKTYKAVFPKTYTEIIQLKGVGSYTAAAISSICFNEAKAVVDGNVYRFIARLLGIKTPIDSTQGKKEFQQLADELLNKKNPGEHNQAMMEFGGQFCKPKNVDCLHCPFAEVCVANRKNLVAQLPVKEKKTKVRTRHLEYFVFNYNNKTFIKQRNNAKDIWKNLFEFPLIEHIESKPEKTLIAEAEKTFGIKKKQFVIKNISAEVKHILSHQILKARFWQVDLKTLPTALKNNFILIDKKKLNDFALPRLIDRWLNG